MIILSFPSKHLIGHANGHWRPKHNATKKARQEAHLATVAAGYQGWGKDTAKITYTIHRPHRRHDKHNLPGATKAYTDGIADALGINDRNIEVDWVIPDDLDPKKVGYMVARIEA